MSAPPPDPPRHSYRFTAPNIETTSKVTRDLVGSLLAMNGHGELTDTARLLVSEVVTNVLQHTGAPLLTVDATITPEAVTVRVTDREPGRRPPLSRSFPEGTAEGGRGLMLVESLADRWGICVNGGFDPVSKSVWFALDSGKP